MQIAPKNACELQYYNQALSEIRLLMSQEPFKSAYARYQGQIPHWMDAAVRQHALFYAVEKCQGRN